MIGIETVTGSVFPEDLGFALMHEHLYLGDWNNRMSDPEWFQHEEALEMIVGVLKDAKMSGVKTLVDVTTRNMGRDIDLIREAAEKTGIQIIASTGVYVDESGYFSKISEDNLAKMIVREAMEGVGKEKIRCGVIKCGTGECGFTENNKKLLRACARAQRETGLPIITHCRPQGTRQGLFQQDIFEEHGVDLQRVVIGHYRNGDPIDYAENVMRRGSYIAIDQMNFNAHQLEYNLKLIPELIRRGYADRLILSHDAVICYNHTRWTDWDHKSYINYAPNSLSYMIREVIPKLMERGVTKEEINMIFINNPRRIFSSEWQQGKECQ
ncbi:MAG: TatD family hydrolase [Clostridiales bacterium]|nr:TatD family hydrolase [Clostridiales bacterium]